MQGVFECIDGHTCGNPVRVVATGGPELKGANMSEKRLHFMREYDWIRTGLMFEPRGHRKGKEMGKLKREALTRKG